MGNEQSVRATHFNRPEDETDALDNETLDQHHINISNKMMLTMYFLINIQIERLVEDAALVADVDMGSTNSKGDYNEKIFIEKLRCMDEAHSELSGLTPEELNSLMARVEMRTANIAYSEPVCVDMKNKIIDCYNMSLIDDNDITKCWGTIVEFSSCVQEASTKMLHARNEKDARDNARRSRHVARAREHALKELPSDGEKRRKVT